MSCAHNRTTVMGPAPVVFNNETQTSQITRSIAMRLFPSSDGASMNRAKAGAGMRLAALILIFLSESIAHTPPISQTTQTAPQKQAVPNSGSSWPPSLSAPGKPAPHYLNGRWEWDGFYPNGFPGKFHTDIQVQNDIISICIEARPNVLQPRIDVYGSVLRQVDVPDRFDAATQQDCRYRPHRRSGSSDIHDPKY